MHDRREATRPHQVDPVQQHRFAQRVDRPATGHQPLHVGRIDRLLHTLAQQDLKHRGFAEDDSGHPTALENVAQSGAQLLASFVGLLGWPSFGHDLQRVQTGCRRQRIGVEGPLLKDSLDGEPKLLMDPNTWSKDGTVALAGLAVSDDAKFVAYGRAEAGSDWNTWKVIDVGDAKKHDDEIKWVKFSNAAWDHAGDGFYYAPDPSSQIACTIGGNVAENSGGVHCLKYGVTTNNLLGCELVLMDGEIIRLGGKVIRSPPYSPRPMPGPTMLSNGSVA